MRVVTSGGEDITLGTTETTPTISIIDYSRRETDDFGVTTVVERGFARRLSVRMSIPSDSVDSVQQILAGLRATSAHWIADDDYLWLNVEGFYKEFELDFATPTLSYCTLTVEGLAETEVVADTGGDPAPLGMASTLRLLQPVTVTDAVLAASNVPENDYPEWAAGTTYALGARVIKASLHRIFESAGAGNVGHDPAALSGEWIDIGPTNRWAMFDQALGSATAKASPLAVTLAAGTVNAVALLDVVGTSVRVQTTGYDQTKAVGSGAIIFLDIPATGAAITVTVTGVGTVSAGTLLVGTLVSLGITETSPTAGITDFSKKDVDEFGEVTVVPRAWAKRMAAKALIRSDSVDVVANRLAAVRAVPSLWIADEGTDSLTVYGFFKDFSLEVGEGVSILSLSVEGLSKAETINPLAVTDLAGTGTLATDDYVYFGTGGTIKEAIGGADATLPGFRTDLGTAAAIAAQGALATKSTVTYGTGDVSGFGTVAARNNVRLGTEVVRADGVTATSDAALVTSLGTAAAISGQGAFATLSSAAYGSSLLTGFGTLAPRNNVRIGTELVRADGVTTTSDAAIVTSLGTAAAISGQGSLATKSTVTYGTGDVSGFGTLAARANVRLQNEVYRADGTTLLTDAAAVTSLGTAAGISGQGAYATLSQTYFGDGLLKETSGGVTATLANFKTSSGTAAAISGQGALATKSTVTYGTGDVAGFGSLAARTNVRIGTEVVRADGVTATSDAALVTSLGTAASIAGQGTGATASNLAGLNASEGAKFAGIASYATSGRNLVSNPGAETAAIAPWAAAETSISGAGLSGFTVSTASPNSGKYCFLLSKAAVGDGGQVNLPAIQVNPGEKYVWRIRYRGDAAAGSGFYFVVREKDSSGSLGAFVILSVETSETVLVTNAAITTSYQTASGVYTVPAGISFIGLAIANWTNGPVALRIDDVEFFKVVDWSSELGGTGKPDDNADVTSTHVASAIAGQGALATSSTVAWGTQVSGRPAELTDGRITAALDGSGDLARNLTTARANSSNLLRYSAGGLFTGELAADVTSTHTASAIAGQGSLATANYSYYGTGGTIKESLGGADATLANFKTSSGTAAGIAGQGTLATKNTAVLDTDVADGTTYKRYAAAEQTKLSGVASYASSGRNLVTNPGAETGAVVPWAGAETNVAGAGLSGFTASTVNPNSGKYCFLLSKAATADGGQVNFPAIQVLPAEKYVWRIRYRGDAAAASGLYFVAREKDSSGSLGAFIIAPTETSETVFLNSVAITTSYQTATGTYTVPAGIYFVGLAVANWSTGPTALRVDDIEFFKVVDWSSELGGAGKPDDNADVTSTHVASAIAGQGALATKSSVDPSTSDVKTLGSIPPTTPDNSFSYTSTTTTVTISWPNMTIYRADGTTISVSSGSQAITTLTAGTSYKVYPYVVDTGGSSGSVAFVSGGAGGGAPAMAYASTGNAAASATMAARGNIPLTSFSVSTPASGSGGGGGGGFIDRR